MRQIHRFATTYPRWKASLPKEEDESGRKFQLLLREAEDLSAEEEVIGVLITACFDALILLILFLDSNPVP